MPLASRAVDAIFARMLVRYGTAWVSKWAGVPTDALKADWAEQLDGLSSGAIRYGLEYLPLDRPPTAAQFKAICHDRPEQLPRMLPAPRADQARVDAELARMRAIQRGRGRLQWAHDLCERERAGDNLSAWQREAWREALRNDRSEALMEFRAIPDDALPPGMREGT